MDAHPIVSREAWLAARQALLRQEKDFNRACDALSAQRRAMPWVRVDQAYRFETPQGTASLADLFTGRSQLLIYHFMFPEVWADGCKSCSFWADNFNGIEVHLAHRDVTLTLMSRSPLAKLTAFKQRMGWTLPWASSLGSEFNFDYQVSFTDEELAAGDVTYNYERRKFPVVEAPGISTFIRNEQGEVFHTYSCYARGLDMLNGAYHLLDLMPKGRDEDGLPYSMDWVRLRDRY
ncbi:MAG: DUF899 domain-containing protein [Gammaproteobacteria bacterium]|nr:DUF899 domain-containing protein [Gammaproteobacteria bacterium]